MLTHDVVNSQAKIGIPMATCIQKPHNSKHNSAELLSSNHLSTTQTQPVVSAYQFTPPHHMTTKTHTRKAAYSVQL